MVKPKAHHLNPFFRCPCLWWRSTNRCTTPSRCSNASCTMNPCPPFPQVTLSSWRLNTGADIILSPRRLWITVARWTWSCSSTISASPGMPRPLSWKGHSLHSLPCLYTHWVCHWTDLLIYRNMLNTMTLTRGSEGPPKAILASLRDKLPSETWTVTPTPPTSVLRLALLWMTFLSGSCPVIITNLTIATTLWTHGPHSLQEVKPLDHQHEQQHERKGRFSATREPLPQLNLP